MVFTVGIPVNDFPNAPCGSRFFEHLGVGILRSNDNESNLRLVGEK